MKLRARLLLAGLVIVVMAGAGTAGLVLLGGRALEDQTFDQLRSVREAKATQIEAEIAQFLDNLDVLAESRAVIEGLTELPAALRALGEPIDQAALDAYYAEEFAPRVTGEDVTVTDALAAQPGTASGRKLQDLYLANNPFPVGEKASLSDAEDGSDYSRIHAEVHPFFRRTLQMLGAYDIFLIDDDGTVLYTVFKEVDVGSNLAAGLLTTSGLAEAWRETQDSTANLAVTDFAPYLPSYNAPAAFAARPVFDDAGVRIGVVAMQLPVDRINDVMTSSRSWSDVGLGDSGETYLVAPDQTMRNDSRFLIEDPDGYFAAISEVEPAETVELIRTFGSTIALQTVDTAGTRDALNGRSGERIFDDYRGVSVLSSYRPLDPGRSGLDWVIMSEIDEAEAFAAENDLIRTAAVALAVGGIVLLGLVAIGANWITRPLRTLEDETTRVETFDFTGDEPYDTTTLDKVAKRGDEIGDLAGAFSRMTASLGDNIRQRAEVEAELNVAAEIQQSMLPLTFPAFPEHSEFQVHARLIPAKEIGGDFFEHGFVDEHRFFIAVGDVSGKGVPAALFMAGIKTLIRSAVLQGESPGGLMTRINADLARENPEMMFATVWLGVVDLHSGRVTYTNAGHNPPLRVQAQGSEWLTEVHGPMVGPIAGVSYRQGEMTLEPEDMLVIFSDGVTEALSPAGVLYGEERLVDTVRGTNMHDARDVTDRVVRDVLAWEEGGERSDDVTVMAMRYLAASQDVSYEARLTLDGDAAEDIARMIEELAEFATVAGVREATVQRAQVALDEVLVNVASYSGASGAVVRAWVDRGSNLTVEVSDNGRPYDPLTTPEPDIDVPLEDREVGGLGVHLVRNLASHTAYDHRAGRNVMTMSFGEGQA